MSESEVDFLERHPELKTRKVLLATLGGFSQVVILLVVFASLFYIVRTQQTGVEARDQLLSCTTPTGKCYQEGQKRTAEYLKTLNQDGVNRELITRATVVAAVACSKVYKDIVDIQECVDKELKNER